MSLRPTSYAALAPLEPDRPAASGRWVAAASGAALLLVAGAVAHAPRSAPAMALAAEVRPERTVGRPLSAMAAPLPLAPPLPAPRPLPAAPLVGPAVTALWTADPTAKPLLSRPDWWLTVVAAAAAFGAAAWLAASRVLPGGRQGPAPDVALLTLVGKKLKGPVFREKCDRVGITLTRFMNEMVRANPDMAELESVFASIQTAGKAIAKLVQRAPIDGMLGKQGSTNVQGEEQKKLDVITNDLLKRVLKYTGRMGVIASEEENEPVAIDNRLHESYGLEDVDEGRYVTVFDPLDGSSNVDAGIPTGTIFGIFERDESCHLPENFFPGETKQAGLLEQQCLRSTLQAGKSLVAAGYVLYSTSTYFVFTFGAGVNGFTLDHSLGEFILTHPNIRIPPRGRIYSINSANRRTWDKPVQVYIDSLSDGTNLAGTEYTSRYIGSMVGDVHRTLMYGGVFAYPADSKNPKGKLRLLYEAAPMSFLVEQAGGKSSTGVVRIMDIPPASVHQRVPCVMGGSEEVEELEAWYHRLGDPAVKAHHLGLLTPKETPPPVAV